MLARRSRNTGFTADYKAEKVALSFRLVGDEQNRIFLIILAIR